MEDLLVLALMVVGFMLIVVSLFLPKIVGKTVYEDTSVSTGARQHEVRSLEKVEEHLLKLEETAREAFGRIDTRSRLLIRLIEEAEIRRRDIDGIIEKLKEARS